MASGNKTILVGKVMGAHGVRGELKLRSYTEEPTTIVRYGNLTDAQGKPWKLKLRATMKDHIVVAADGVADRNAAELLKGLELFLPREALPEPENDGEFYIEDLVGLAVDDTHGVPFGTVHAVHNYGASDIIEITLAETGKKEMFAFTEANFPTIDFASKTMVISPPEIVE